LGNTDCRQLVPFGTREDIELAVKDTIANPAPGGGYIMSSCNSIHAGCRPDDYAAMVGAAHNYRAYKGQA